MQSFPELTVDLVARIGALLGATPREATYTAAGMPVYEIVVPAVALAVDVTLLVWVGLRRADIRIGDSTMVFKHIDLVELYPGVEVLFRRLAPPGYLFLSVGGRASMVV